MDYGSDGGEETNDNKEDTADESYISRQVTKFKSKSNFIFTFTFTFVPHSIVLQKTRVEYTYEEGERDKEEVNDIWCWPGEVGWYGSITMVMMR